MRGVRTFVSAVAIVVGAALVVAWCGAWLLLRAVDDGAVARTLASAALSTPAVTDRIGDEILADASASLSAQGLDVSALGIDAQLSDSLTSLVRSAEFKELVLAEVDRAHALLLHELVRDDRQSGPLVITVDVNRTVNESLSELPVVGPSLDDVEAAPVEFEVVSAESFDKARNAYSRVDFAERHFLWAGLALIVAGLAVSTRRRLVVPKFLLAVGTFALGAAALLVLVTPSRVAAALPGGESGTWGGVVAETIANDSLPTVQRTLAIAGAAALVIGGLLLLALRSAGGSRH